jgi:hypothetical protein
MAQGSKQGRMVFDIRGRRRHVVKAVYAILALLMVASLFLVTGAINLNSLFGTASTGESAVTSFEKQAENIEAKLAKTPGDEQLLASLTRTRINTANAMISAGAGESESGVEEVKQQLAQASEDWSEYVKVAAEPSANVAIQVAPSLFQLAELSSGAEEAMVNIKAATEAQEIVAKTRPSLNSYSTLAFYAVFTQNYKAAEEALKKALAEANTKFERESLENKYEEVEKNAKEFGKELKTEQVTKKSESAGKGKLESPFEGLGTTGLGG